MPRFVRRFLQLALCLSLVGCASWENLPVAVEYVAGFETGDSVHGPFEVEMPVVD